jgi:glycosyltransferase involved in cell wall biosynthesis
MKNFIILPCYNEEINISNVLKDIENLRLEKNIIVIDDGSFDKTYDLVKDNFKNVILLKHKVNLGKGAALKTGCLVAIKLGAENIILMDSDGQHSSKFISEIIRKLENENFDIVFGSRIIDIRKMPIAPYLGNKILTFITNLFFGSNLKDSQSGFRGFKSSAYERLDWNSVDYSVENEIIYNAYKNKLKCGEIFIDTIYKDNYKGTTPFDGIKILLNIIKNRFL